MDMEVPPQTPDQVNETRMGYMLEMLLQSNNKVELIHPDSGAFGIVMSIHIPGKTYFFGPDSDGRLIVPIHKFICKILITPVTSSLQSINIDYKGNIVNKMLTSETNAVVEAQTQSNIYISTVTYGDPVCTDIAAFLKIRSADIRSFFTILFPRLVLDTQCRQSIQCMFIDSLIDEIERNRLDIFATFMEYAVGNDPTAVTLPFLDRKLFVPSPNNDNMFSSIIAQILITVIEEEGEKYNLDYHEGNVLITRISPGIFKTVLIDFGIIMDIPKLLSITNDLVKQQELQQYISNIKGVINTITQNKTINYSLLTDQLVLTLIQNLFKLHQRIIELYNGYKSKIDWILDYLCQTQIPIISRQRVKALDNKIFEILEEIDNSSSQFSTQAAKAALTNKKAEIIPLIMDNINALTASNQGIRNTCVLMKKFMTAKQGSHFNPQSVLAEYNAGNYYTSGFSILTLPKIQSAKTKMIEQQKLTEANQAAILAKIKRKELRINNMELLKIIGPTMITRSSSNRDTRKATQQLQTIIDTAQTPKDIDEGFIRFCTTNILNKTANFCSTLAEKASNYFWSTNTSTSTMGGKKTRRMGILHPCAPFGKMRMATLLFADENAPEWAFSKRKGLNKRKTIKYKPKKYSKNNMPKKRHTRRAH
jgi:hypothetical protein